MIPQIMKKYFSLLFLLVFIQISFLKAQEFKREIKIPGVISAYKFIEDNSGDFVVVGNSYDVKNKERFSFLVKVSPQGELKYLRKFGENSQARADVFFSDLISTDENNLIVVGYMTKPGSKIKQGYVLGVDHEFNTQWEEIYVRDEKNPNTKLGGISRRKDGLYIISGREQNMAGDKAVSGYKELFVTMDAYGRFENGKVFRLSKIGEMASSETERMAPVPQKSAFRINSQMDTTNEVSENDASYFVNNHPDYSSMRGIVKAGNNFYFNTVKFEKGIDSNDPGKYTHQFMVLNAEYDTIKRVNLHEGDYSKKYSCGMDFRNGSFFTVTSYNQRDRRFDINNGYSKVYLAKTDKQGAIKWEREFEDPDGHIHAKTVLATKDGGAMIMGYYEANGDPSNRNLYLIKVDEKGIANSVKPEFNENNRIAASPNPTSGIFQLTWENSQESEWRVKLYGMTGRLVRDKEFTPASSASFDITDLPVGTYIYTIETKKNKYYTGKIIKAN